MARVNITIPDELLAGARSAHLNVSRIAAAAVAEELDRRSKIAALDSYLDELEAGLGPIPPQEQEDARRWADRMLSDEPEPARPRAAHA